VQCANIACGRQQQMNAHSCAGCSSAAYAAADAKKFNAAAEGLQLQCTRANTGS